MKYVWLILVMAVAACSQNQGVKQEAAPEKAVAAQAPAKVEQAQQQVEEAKAVVSEKAVAAQAPAKVEQAKQQAEEAKAVVSEKAVAAQMPAKMDKPKQASKAAHDMASAKPMKNKEQPKPQAAKKMVAPLVQGKGPIKSKPDPASSKHMIKTAPAMDVAKATMLLKKCKSCHTADKDKVGPSWKKIQQAYGSAQSLAAVFEQGFAVDVRKVAAMSPKFKKKAKTMTGQYKNLIQKQVKKGKFTYGDIAAAIFMQ